MGLRPGLPKLAATRRRVALLAASIQLASTARRDKITNAHQPPRLIREQPIEAPQLAIEVDGFAHDNAVAATHDAHRDAWLAQRGVRVMRINAAEGLRDDKLEGVPLGIAEAAIGPPRPPCPPPPPPPGGGRTGGC